MFEKICAASKLAKAVLANEFDQFPLAGSDGRLRGNRSECRILQCVNRLSDSCAHVPMRTERVLWQMAGEALLAFTFFGIHNKQKGHF